MHTDADRKRFEQALFGTEPAQTLVALAKSLKAEGMDQVPMYHLFAEYLQQIAGSDPRFDAILETMDLIWGGGWANGRALFDTELTDSDIAQSTSTGHGFNPRFDP